MSVKVSFIVPSYRQKRFLGRALESIRDQDLPAGSFEVLVFDGGSEDGTRELLANEPLVNHWESTRDRGQSHAVNKGLKVAQGEIIAWLNSDDCYLPGAIQAATEFLDEHPEVDVVYGRSYDIDEDGTRLGDFPTRDWSSEALVDSCFISQPACFFRKSFAERNGLLREDLHYTMDYDYWLRASPWARFSHLPAFLACNRVHPEAKSTVQRSRQLRESAWVAHQASGQWREAWLRRIASAEGRRWLTPYRLASSPLRPGLSALFYQIYRRQIAAGKSPFPQE